MTVTVFANRKGGVGKSTTAAEVIAELARRGARVLGVDLCQQANLSCLLGITNPAKVRGTAAEVLRGDATTNDSVTASPSVAGVDALVAYADLRKLAESLRPTRIRELVQGEWSRWDQVVIDCPPAMDALTLAALVASDRIVAPVRAAKPALDGLDALADAIAVQINPKLNPTARVDWIVPTQIDRRRALDRETLDVLNEDHPGRVTTPIRHSIVAEYAYMTSQPITSYEPRSPIAQDYAAAVAQILG